MLHAEGLHTAAARRAAATAAPPPQSAPHRSGAAAAAFGAFDGSPRYPDMPLSAGRANSFPGAPFLAEGGLDNDTNDPKAVRSRLNRVDGGVGRRLTLDRLKTQFGKGLKEAAEALGMCPTTLKRACRRLGVKRWPRNAEAAAAVLHEAEAEAAAAGGGAAAADAAVGASAHGGYDTSAAAAAAGGDSGMDLGGAWRGMSPPDGPAEMLPAVGGEFEEHALGDFMGMLDGGDMDSGLHVH